MRRPMLQPGDLQLHHVRQEISRKVAFPEELAVIIDEKAGRALLDEIAACRSPDELLTLTYSLSRRRLNDLFGAVLTISAAAGEELFGRLLEVFSLRASLSLTHTAWAYYQRQYPNDRLGRVLSTLVQSLPVKEDDPAFLKELKQVTIDHLLPRRLADRLRNPATRDAARLAIPTPAGDQHPEDMPVAEDMIPVARLREKYPLLTAYTSLSTLPKESMAASCMASSLCGYMIRLSILPDTALAAAFMTAWFQEAADQDILINADLFIQALRISRRPSQLALLSRYLSDYRLSSNWDHINKAILELYGIPELQAVAIPQEAATEKKAEADNPFAPQNGRSKAANDPWSQSASGRGGTAYPTEQLPQSEPKPSIQNTENADSAGLRKQKGLMNWLRGRKDKPAPGETDQNSRKEQASPQASIPQPAAADRPSPQSETENQDRDKLFAELQQSLLEGIRQPELQADLPEVKTDGDLWTHLDGDCAVRYRQWAFMHQIKNHSSDARKEIFLQRYALKIVGVESWDEQTQLIELDGFYLVNHKDEANRLWYYDSNTITMLAEGQRERPPLNRPEQPVINSRDAMLQDTISNIVCLPLDAVNMLFSHDFIKRVYEDRQDRTS